MADTRVQLEVEDWIRREWIVKQFGQKFHRDRVKLSPGGVFDFDAVSADGKIIATISTSGSVTATGNYAVGKMLKIRSDMYFLLLANAERRVVVLTEQDMHDQCEKEKAAGRVPSSIEFVHAPLPSNLQVKLQASRKKASTEMTGP